MSYSQVKTPRFYIDYVQYLNSMGVCAEPAVAEEDGTWNFETEDKQLMSKVWGLTNYKPFTLIPEGIDGDKTGGVVRRVFSHSDGVPMYGIGQSLADCNYIAIFGHNLATLGVTFKVSLKIFNVQSQEHLFATARTLTPLYNCSVYGSNTNYATANSDGVCILGFDGFQLTEFDNISLTAIEFSIQAGDPSTGSWDNISGMPEISSIYMGKYFDMPMYPDL